MAHYEKHFSLISGECIRVTKINLDGRIQYYWQVYRVSPYGPYIRSGYSKSIKMAKRDALP